MPFDTDQFLEVFAAYNQAVFPIQIVLLAAALLAIFLSVKTGRKSSKIVAAILSFFWLWMGIVYHWLFFSRINRAALIFGAIFILQSTIIFYAGVMRDNLAFRFHPDASGVVGILLMLYALVVYPLLGFLFHHTYPYAPTFGLPCPTVIFTFGVLLWTDKKVPLYVLVIPLLWSLIGFSAAFLLRISEDIGLLLAGIIATTLLLFRRHKSQNHSAMQPN
jgi:hypothetical protein